MHTTVANSQLPCLSCNKTFNCHFNADLDCCAACRQRKINGFEFLHDEIAAYGTAYPPFNFDPPTSDDEDLTSILATDAVTATKAISPDELNKHLPSRAPAQPDVPGWLPVANTGTRGDTNRSPSVFSIRSTPNTTSTALTPWSPPLATVKSPKKKKLVQQADSSTPAETPAPDTTKSCVIDNRKIGKDPRHNKNTGQHCTGCCKKWASTKGISLFMQCGIPTPPVYQAMIDEFRKNPIEALSRVTSESQRFVQDVGTTGSRFLQNFSPGLKQSGRSLSVQAAMQPQSGVAPSLNMSWSPPALSTYPSPYMVGSTIDNQGRQVVGNWRPSIYGQELQAPPASLAHKRSYDEVMDDVYADMKQSGGKRAKVEIDLTNF